MNFGVIRTTEATEYPLARRLSGVEYENASGRVVGAAKPATFSLFAERVELGLNSAERRLEGRGGAWPSSAKQGSPIKLGLGKSSVTTADNVQGQFSLSYAPLSLPCPECDRVGMVTNGDELDESECWACHVEDEPECVAKERAEYAACVS